MTPAEANYLSPRLYRVENNPEYKHLMRALTAGVDDKSWRMVVILSKAANRIWSKK